MARTDQILGNYERQSGSLDLKSDILSNSIDDGADSKEVENLVNYYKDVAALKLGLDGKNPTDISHDTRMTPLYLEEDTDNDLEQELEELDNGQQDNTLEQKLQELQGVNPEALATQIDEDLERQMDEYLSDQLDNENIGYQAEEIAKQTVAIGSEKALREPLVEGEEVRLEQPINQERKKPARGFLDRIARVFNAILRNLFSTKAAKQKHRLDKAFGQLRDTNKRSNQIKVTGLQLKGLTKTNTENWGNRKKALQNRGRDLKRKQSLNKRQIPKL